MAPNDQYLLVFMLMLLCNTLPLTVNWTYQLASNEWIILETVGYLF